jgi:hypothetical protein
VLAFLPAAAAAKPLTRQGLRLGLARDPAAGRVLGGITDQGWPVVFAISKNEKQVVGAIAGMALSCASGQQFSLEDAWPKLRIGPGGAVHARAVIPPTSAGSGVSITGGSHSMNGKLNRKTGDFSGVWHLQLSFRTSNGTDSCDSGAVAFRLKL